MIKLLVGLGNPGKKYEHTRHNIGFDIIDYYAEVHNLDFKKKFDGLVTEHVVASNKIIILKPQTFMNKSGYSVKKIIDFYKIELDDILIVHDDLDLDFNTLRIKTNSGSGGQNGIKDIINQLGTKEFARLKFGIKNEYKKDTVDFVLSQFNKAEQQELPQLINQAVNILEDFTKLDKITDVMNKYN